MDSRTAAHVLTRIAALIELGGGNRFKAKAYEGAAQALRSIDTDDLTPLLRTGAIAELPGIGPATLSVIRELAETGESSYLAKLDAEVPQGLLELLRVPTLGAAKIHLLHQELDVRSLEDLEAAARDGRLGALKGFGPKGVEKILKGIERLRESGSSQLLPAALVEGARILASVRAHPDVARAELAGSLRRHLEVVRDIDVVAGCTAPPEQVAASFASAPGVRHATRHGDGRVAVSYVDGTCLDLRCVADREFALALWRATGTRDHVEKALAHAAGHGVRFVDGRLLDPAGRPMTADDEAAVYAALLLSYVPPELREGTTEIDAAARNALPMLVAMDDIRGVLHCHSTYSDGRATIAEMAAAARALGWSYIGITDHSQAAFYAGGLKRDEVLAQHDEIDALNATFSDFRILKGIEADILADGRVDYDDDVLDRFEYVIGSVHSRFAMGEAQMTQRVLTALDDPRLTILAHPTGRLLLNREPYAIDMASRSRSGPMRIRRGDSNGPRSESEWRARAGSRPPTFSTRVAPTRCWPSRDTAGPGLRMRDDAKPAKRARKAAVKKAKPRLAKHKLLKSRKAKPPHKPRLKRALIEPDPRRAAEIYARLERTYPEAHCALDHRSPFELLVATILSAQCTDKRVNMVTPALFAKYPDAAALASARQEDVEELIRSAGFFRTKSANIIAMSNALVERHGGLVPPAMDDLVKLPGVGRKTANVILGNAFSMNEGIVVDTHVARLSNRLGFVASDDPVKIEAALMPLFPRANWTMLSHLLIEHGRQICDARKPRCGDCPVRELCPSALV